MSHNVLHDRSGSLREEGALADPCVVALAMSPRSGGNSDFLLDAAIGEVKGGGIDVVRYRAADLAVTPCAGCGSCADGKGCVIEDRFLGLADELTACSAVIVSTPLYFMNVPAAGKAIVDRCQAFWAAKYHAGVDLFGGRRRQGLLLACAGANHGPGGADVFRGLEDTMKYVFDALALDPLDPVLVSGVEEAGEVRERRDATESACARGRELAAFLKTG